MNHISQSMWILDKVLIGYFQVLIDIQCHLPVKSPGPP